MKRLHLLAICVVLLAGCATTIPASTRSGRIMDVKVGEAISPQEITLERGDEVRWINGRNDSLKIEFVNSLAGNLSCANHFTGSTTTISSNGSASLCFSSAGSYTYTARMDSSISGGEKNLRGLVIVR